MSPRPAHAPASPELAVGPRLALVGAAVGGAAVVGAVVVRLPVVELPIVGLPVVGALDGLSAPAAPVLGASVVAPFLHAAQHRLTVRF